MIKKQNKTEALKKHKGLEHVLQVYKSLRRGEESLSVLTTLDILREQIEDALRGDTLDRDVDAAFAWLAAFLDCTEQTDHDKAIDRIDYLYARMQERGVGVSVGNLMYELGEIKKLLLPKE